MHTRYRVRTPPVVHETIDGEVVIIDFTSGAYYSCTETAAEVWQRLATGASISEIADTIARGYETADHDVSGDVTRFVRELEAEGLVAPAADGPREEGTTAVGTPARGGYAPPRLEKFTDMADLIVLDPVHDVTAAGWPHRTGPDEPAP